MSNSKSSNRLEEQRYQIRKAFENGAPLQYRDVDGIDPPDWRDATWCAWDWSRYDYRIKTKEATKDVAVAIYPYLHNGVVVWSAVGDMHKHYPNYKAIKRFRTIGGIRHAIIEEKVE